MTFLRIAGCGLACVLAVVCAQTAQAAPVLVMGTDGHVRLHRHSLAPAETFPSPRSAGRARTATAHLSRSGPTVPGALKSLLASGAIDDATYGERRSAYDDAKQTLKKLSGRRKPELGSVIWTLEGIAARGQLTASRLAPLWLTLQRNVEWWTKGPLLANGRRVGFSGSQIVWQYYAGEGIQIQVLGTFGKVNALWGSRNNTALNAAVDELLPLAAERAGGVAWEYYFPYRAGQAPWVSSLAQGTALQALSRAATRLKRTDEVFPVTSRALTIFQTAAPEGVRVPAGAGVHYAQYSFEPGLRILNGFLQSLVGLYDYARLAKDPTAQQLYADGVARAREEVPTYDTGAWSLYSRGTVTHESDLNYHELLTGFLAALCSRTGEAVFCATQERFTADLTTAPVVTLRTTKLRGGTYSQIKLDLSKISSATLRVQRAGKLVYTRPIGLLAYGRRTLGWQVPRRKGTYDVTVAVRDLAGNAATTDGAVQVLAPRKRKGGK
ncbi:MAG: hypothetical protein QOE28_2019 [Solirubrobacteraceae bacterium]|nr:hypothetical protein [Solirubrobacteraceae bacterium]